MSYTAEQRGEYDFWARVNKSGPTLRPELGPCWLWLGAPDANGYGRLTSKGTYAHRRAWELERGAIPEGVHHGTTCVLHKCDNPICVRPDHLFLGTHSDNMLDMYAKRRAPPRSGPKNPRRGADVASAKLDEAAVIAMRKEHASGVTSVAIGKAFGVSQATAHRIVTRQSWRHVG